MASSRSLVVLTEYSWPRGLGWWMNIYPDGSIAKIAITLKRKSVNVAKWEAPKKKNFCKK